MISFPTIMVVLFFIGVKKEKPWGKSAVIVCTLGLIAFVLGPRLMPRGSSTGPDMAAMPDEVAYETARLIGKGLRNRAPADGAILILHRPDLSGGDLRSAEAEWRKGLTDGLGAAQLNVLDVVAVKQDVPPEMLGPDGEAPPGMPDGSRGVFRPYTASDFNKALESYEDKQIDVVVSFAGLPEDLAELSLYQRAKPPAVAAYFALPTLDGLGEYMKRGMIVAAVRREGDTFKLYTPDSLPGQTMVP